MLDLALLGLGEDGHTASLFPGRPEVLDSSGALCLAVHDAPKPPPERVTLSLPVLRAARRCLLLVTGAGKADALAAVLAGPGGRGFDTPASLLASERLHVVADAAAAPPGTSATPPGTAAAPPGTSAAPPETAATPPGTAAAHPSERAHDPRDDRSSPRENRTF